VLAEHAEIAQTRPDLRGRSPVQIPKPADRDRFQRLVPDVPGVETKPMFGKTPTTKARA
jgi:hypothetical protein